MLHFADEASIDMAAVAANGGLPFTVGPGNAQGSVFRGKLTLAHVWLLHQPVYQRR